VNGSARWAIPGTDVLETSAQLRLEPMAGRADASFGRSDDVFFPGTIVTRTERMSQRAGHRIEWPTAGLLLAFFAAYLGVVLGHQALPWWLAVPVLAVLGGFFMSLQHEVLHGHPTSSTNLNTLIGFAPLSLYLPYLRYKDLHTQHHTGELTHPLIDPESFYVDPEVWQRAGKWRRRYIQCTRTVLGRLTLGSLQAIIGYVVSDLLLATRNRQVARQWLVHLAGAALLGWWLFAVVDVPVWEYLVGFVLCGYMLTQLRAFAEHRAVPSGTRSAVINAGPVMSLMFLNNNLHHTHHAAPSEPWYQLPALHREMGSDALAEAGAGRYPGGYAEVIRRYLVHPFCQAPHPLLALGQRSPASPTGSGE
jgi:fatty acid desaturase